MLPTGSSKLFFYVLMVCVPWLGVMVVLLPLVALLHDVVTCCHIEHVSFTMWANINHGSTQPVMSISMPLVFATVA